MTAAGAAPTPPPARSAKQVQGARSREEILDAAERLMGARGYAATSISTLARESGLPASSIYWHFGSKSGVLGAVMERGSRRFFDDARAAWEAHGEPRDRLAALMRRSLVSIHEHPQFLRLLIVLLLGVEGEHAQGDVVARVRDEGAALLRSGLERAYEPWGAALAERIAVELGDLALALFDGMFLATEAARDQPARTDALLDRTVSALHAMAVQLRDVPSTQHPG